MTLVSKGSSRHVLSPDQPPGWAGEDTLIPSPAPDSPGIFVFHPIAVPPTPQPFLPFLRLPAISCI